MELRALLDLDDEVLNPSNKPARELRVNQLQSKMTEMKTEIYELTDRSKGSDFTAGDKERWSNLTHGYERAKVVLERLYAVDHAELAKLAGTGSEIRGDRPLAGFNVGKQTDPYDPTNQASVRSKAMQAVETNEHATD